jgi:hypothetical protein
MFVDEVVVVVVGVVASEAAVVVTETAVGAEGVVVVRRGNLTTGWLVDVFCFASFFFCSVLCFFLCFFSPPSLSRFLF